MPHDPKVIPIMRGRLVLIAGRYGTPRLLVTEYARSLGYPARSCSSATEALAFLTRHRTGVQCLLTDLDLPDMDGIALAEGAKDLVPGLRVVLMVPPDYPAARLPRPGWHDLHQLTQPVFADQLRETLSDLLGPPGKRNRLPSMGWPRRRRPSGSHQR